MSDKEITKYDIAYRDVLCTGVKWRYPENNIFYFTKDGKTYEFTQTEDVHCIADTDHIRCVIVDQFLPWWKNERIKELEAENAALREKLENVGELPCKIGNIVYKVHDRCNGKACPYNGDYGQWRCHYEGKQRCEPFVETIQFCYEHIPQIGKTIFISKEKAEARLAELKGDKER